MKKIILSIFKREGKKFNPFAQLANKGLMDIKSERGYFVSGVGRSGTHFIASLFGQSSSIAAYHMDDIGDAIGDSFSWYARWYGLPVSANGFLQARSFLMMQAKRLQKVYLESNPMIALHLEDINKAFDARFVIMVRNPRKVVESHLVKGWYKITQVDDDNLAPGYQYFHDRPNHFFSRVMPRSISEKNTWQKLSRHGKIAWMWQMTYEKIFDQLNHLDKDKYRVVVLDDFDYDKYCQLAAFLEVEPVTEEVFIGINAKKPGKGKVEKIEWNDLEMREFNNEISKVLTSFEKLGVKKKWLF